MQNIFWGECMNSYEYFGVMLDVSRNAVKTVSSVKKAIDCLQKMGYNALELYAEDTYEVEGEPYFGYQRGRYTAKELQELDRYARERGVELIPCIQTLAHFTHLARLPHYRPMIDTADILLIDDERTYTLIDKIFASIAKNFTSRQINIGMDEADMVGLGQYYHEHGHSNRFEILNRHLGRVCEIAEKYGFTPHMWSDMFFRLQTKGDYYAKGVHIDPEVAAKVPQKVELAYWDYYHTKIEDYDDMIAAHQEFGRGLWFAGGAWSWQGFAPLNYHSLHTMRPAMECVRKHGVKKVLITMWGDNGGECSFFSLLPSLYAIRQYAEGNFDEESIRKGFEALFGLSYDDFILLDSPNYRKGNPQQSQADDSCKAFLYTDPFMGILDDWAEKELGVDYAARANALFAAEKRAGEYGYIFRSLGQLCLVLDTKVCLGVKTRKAYKEGNKKALKALVKEYVALEKRLKAFYQAFKTLWFTENKSFGWEVQDVRLGGLTQRVSHCKGRLKEYLAGEIATIEELEIEILPFRAGGVDHYWYADLVTRNGL